jgi:hypothetical protein
VSRTICTLFISSSREALDEVAVKGKGEVPPVGEDSLEAAGIGGVDEPFVTSRSTANLFSFLIMDRFTV